MLHPNQRESLTLMPGITTAHTVTGQLGITEVITDIRTIMEGRGEVLTPNLHQNQIQREDLKLMPKPGMPTMDTIQHGITPGYYGYYPYYYYGK
jgi:hypothetical protein